MDKHEGAAHDWLAAGDEHFQIALHADQIVFWAAGASGACELVSENWLTTTGLPVAGALGHGWIAAVASDDRDLVIETVRRSVSEHCGFYLRYRLQHADGSQRWVLHDASPRLLPSGRFNGLIGTLSDCSDLQAGEQALASAAQRVYDFVASVALPALSIDLAGKIVHCNAPLAALLGREPQALLGDDWVGDWIAGNGRNLIRSLLAGDLPLSELPSEIECGLRADAGERLFRWHLTLLRDFDGRPRSITWLGNDITHWRRLGDNFRLAARIFETCSEAIVITDQENRIISVNQAFTRLTGYSAEEAVGSNPRILKSGRHSPEFYVRMWQQLQADGFWRGDIWDRRKDGSIYPKYLSISIIRDEHGRHTHYSAIFHDITERKALEERLDHLAHYDELTDLPNRALLQDRLELAIANAERWQRKFALLFVDLDGFKAVNDTHGHALGDELLRHVARRLRLAIRGVDTAARLGGDEFVVILGDIHGAEDAAAVAEKIMTSLAEPYSFPETTVALSASIGISLYPNDENDPGELLRAADEAMYRAKQAGKKRVFFHAATPT